MSRGVLTTRAMYQVWQISQSSREPSNVELQVSRSNTVQPTSYKERKHHCFKLFTYSTNARTGRPDIPVPIYGVARVTSIEPAMSMCAQSIFGSAPSTPSTPSTNALRKSAAVALPAGEPPVYHGSEQWALGDDKTAYVLKVGVARVDLRAIFLIKR